MWLIMMDKSKQLAGKQVDDADGIATSHSNDVAKLNTTYSPAINNAVHSQAGGGIIE